MLLGPAASAKSLYAEPKYAAILVNADSGEVMYARQADAPRLPASITKVLTLYMAFDAITKGQLRETDYITMTARAAAQPPSKLGLRVGEQISVRDAIGVIATRSANDIAVALAEHIAGSEAAYCAMMTAKARSLGMTKSTFVNATGLPDKRQLTTARDIATLSRALIRDFPQYYYVFSKVAYDFEGQSIGNHNHLLKTLPGVDGIKTGFTNAAGFTLAASAAHDGVRLIAVVLGGPNRLARDGNVTSLLDTGFDVLTKRSRGQMTTVSANLSEIDDLNDQTLEHLAEQGSGDDEVLAVTRPR
ncbi:D-alanyl-D-alanine carboxypeptidase family protein [Glacieibacterium frigidum]|uniref:D-alanyl-D-alanine carboxypeptidase n=1 Tax=Glacieibacterium frigidum TaxID=2593303 RepID=A0A552UF73_9SPHN|nr:D-alanyl-D-alanine carboxypeptidase family protein [Glacieibacterium frigidum]TRW16878.1 D-alanyl-D-alanine carboxypeptidase [Glacieibacterium frigidum]